MRHLLVDEMKWLKWEDYWWTGKVKCRQLHLPLPHDEIFPSNQDHVIYRTKNLLQEGI